MDIKKILLSISLMSGVSHVRSSTGLVGLFYNSHLNIEFVTCTIGKAVFLDGLCSYCLDAFKPPDQLSSACATANQINRNSSMTCDRNLTWTTIFIRTIGNEEQSQCPSTVDRWRQLSESHVCCTTNAEDFHKLKLWESIVSLRSKTLNVVTIERAPFTRYENQVFSGVVIEILNALETKYNLRVTVNLPTDGQWGAATDNGSWNGMLGMIIRKEADLGAAGFSVTLERSRVVSFTWAFHQEPTAILIPPPTEGEKFTVLVRPLDKQVWAALLATVFILIPSFYILHILHLKFIQGDFYELNICKMFGSLFWFILGSILQQGIQSPAEKTRFLSVIWLFMTLIIANTYLGFLVSYLSSPKLYNLVDSLEDLANQHKLKWTYRSNTAHRALFKPEWSTGTYKLIADRTNPLDLVGTDEAGVVQVLKNHKAFIKEKSYLDVALQTDYELVKQCRFTLAKETFFTVGVAWAVRKRSPILEVLDTEISNTISTGLMEKWKTIHWPQKLSCADAASYIISVQPKTRKLRLGDLQGAWFLFLSGIIISTLGFAVEKFYCTLSQNIILLIFKWKIATVWKYTR